MNWLSASRTGYGLAVLAVPEKAGGLIAGMQLTPGTLRAMQVLAARQMLQAAVCAVAPTRCVRALEAAVDAVHAATMAAVAVLSRNDSSRRAAAVNVISAAAFVAADVAAMRRTHVDASRPGASRHPLLRTRDRLAQRICTLLRLPLPEDAKGAEPDEPD